ncbi:methylated-DNA--[protein]-cysteine S-methyltransferase [Legionella taurinensis]|uniref:methylated-DNA--[protein]-cysteine S-methyltransferase n=1 Tax=Legionella taurinensis TaxID=70611 RepID=A0A3A5L5F4_9GAMM|nr:bifunctional transcriptional activator/DNA repair protein Ada [Legionella taurinensis]MDX1837450.1 trifunctional transcriptional activator/DNA repair protein Ada/methylated-DNA--[protein]-cysteine S-methyltransferase [Legionella taurinensis]PUT40795.1 bifunctional transcriptional activator/DNA repair enzyme protein Ada [Legionella taurinensis]PUT44217.1 bifunctional transcriptional activator/DNA repair enzyme protein Ada [Legionella taurinensis]PUT47518.1 bifunctional transcriptional activat
MLTETIKKHYYQALLDHNPHYEGVFYVGVTTTGIFCRPTCPARKPKYEHCEFFLTAQQALLASYRPCKRCRPLSHPNQVSEVVQHLVAAVEANPEKRWQNGDFQALSTDAVKARRQFKKRFGMTFVEYARARRMGLAVKKIREGESVIEAQLATGYESGSGFRDAFARIMGAAPSKKGHFVLLKTALLDTPLGPMMAVASDTQLYLLEFIERRGLEREIERLRQKASAAIVPGSAPPIDQIDRELQAYFAGTLTEFTTPLCLMGSPFQQQVWDVLRQIPSGQTRSYTQVAQALSKPFACRAVANANGANQLAIVIPCHRVINSNGELGGYGGGIAKKKWLLEHERRGINVIL